MPSQELIAYIQSMLRNGYTSQQVRDYLLRSGYQVPDIDEAFGQMQQQSALAEPSHTPWLWIAGAVLGLGVGGVIIALLFAGPASISLTATPTQVEVRAGDSLTIKDVVKAGGSVSVSHVITDPDTQQALGVPVVQKVSGTQMVTVPVPSSATPGRYVVSVTAADNSGKETKTSFSISVAAARPTCSDGIQNQGETGVDCGGPCAACPEVEQPAQPTGNESTAPPIAAPVMDCPGGCNDFDITTDDSCVQGACVHTPKPNVCGNGVCNAGETSDSCPQDCGAGPDAPSADQVIEDAKTAAATDQDRATGLCNSVPRPQDKDRCFSVIASTAGNSVLCAQITEDITRDQCYIDFALSKNEFDVCEKIVNRYLRGSCNSLRNLRQLEKQRQQEAAQQAPAQEPTPIPANASQSGAAPGPTSCTTPRPTSCNDPTAEVCGNNGRTYSNGCLACSDSGVQSYNAGACS